MGIIFVIMLLGLVQVASPQETLDTTTAVTLKPELDSVTLQAEKPLKRDFGREFPLVKNWRRGNLVGLQFALIRNVVEGDMAGFQLAGGYNVTEGATKGAQVAGLANISANDAHAAQISALANVSGGDAGVQLAGIANVGEGQALAQISGVASIAGESSTLGQVALLANISGQAAFSQIAGLANVSGSHAWIQIGLINVTPRARLMQLGLINVAEEHNGLPLGLLNIVGGEPLRLGFTLDGRGQGTLSLRSGSRYAYSIVGLQGDQSVTLQSLSPLFYGFGVQLPLWRFALAAEYARNQRPGDLGDRFDIITLRSSLRFNYRMGLVVGIAVPYNSIRNGTYNDQLDQSWLIGFEWYIPTF
ncbi:MAG: hypothetical protein JSU61_13035 [Fidelibacterota bacterium]|nr:MAG: hypothetical protein JSU61_13035 [Candidatus Neomarinimicrobiota bacterium]